MTRTDPLDVPRPDARLHLGVFFQGVNHWTVWSDPASGSQIDPANFRRVAQTAERGLFDAFFLGRGCDCARSTDRSTTSMSPDGRTPSPNSPRWPP